MNMKKRTFTIKKIPVSEREKRQRAEFYSLETGEPVDIEAFVKSDIFDEYLELKCVKCGHEETVDYEFVEEMWEPGEAYPRLICVKCDSRNDDDGYLVPLDIYNTDFKK